MGRLKRLVFCVLIIGMNFTIPVNIYSQHEKQNFEFGFSERLRFVNWNNAITLNDGADAANSFTRHRTSLWAKWEPVTDLEIFAKLTNEFRYYFKPDNKEFEIHEVIFDNLYIEYKPLKNIPVTLTLGRQNIILGEGFVVMDGHPLDGSRSIYFNALRADIQLRKDDNLTLFYSYQPTTDDIVKPINDQQQMLIEKPEKGLGLYYRTKFDNAMILDAYVLNKKINSTSRDSVEENYNTFGMRFAFPITERLNITAEAAFQNGSYGSNKRNSFGGYTYLSYKLNHSLPYPKTVTIGTFNLSGDDPATKDTEGWDAVFSRWPKWSESYIYTQILEYGGKVAYWSNIISIYGSVKFDLCDKLTLDIDLHHLMSHYDMPPASLLNAGSGKTRGELLITKLNAKINKNLSGHLLLENFWPGNYYDSNADGYYWLRFELMYTL